MEINFYAKKIYKIVCQIPRGKVTTYGALSKKINLNCPRLVGKILHNNPKPGAIPCHRVVNWKGKVSKNFAFGGAKAQIQRLRKECVVIKNKIVDMKKYFWFV